MALIPCTECGKRISNKAASCPHCGCIPKSKTKIYKYIICTAAVLIISIMLFYSYNNNKENNNIINNVSYSIIDKVSIAAIPKIICSKGNMTLIELNSKTKVYISVANKNTIFRTNEVVKIVQSPRHHIDYLDYMILNDGSLYVIGTANRSGDNYIFDLMTNPNNNESVHVKSGKATVSNWIKVLDGVNDIGFDSRGSLVIYQKPKLILTRLDYGNEQISIIDVGDKLTKIAKNFIHIDGKLCGIINSDTKKIFPIIHDSVKQVESHNHTEGISILKSDGTVWSWHDRQIKGIDNVIKIAGATYSNSGHMLAIRKDGTLWAWGNNDYGQLGNRTRISAEVPIQVNGISDIVDISVGSYHSVAIDKHGKIWIWGKFDEDRSKGHDKDKDILMPTEHIINNT